MSWKKGVGRRLLGGRGVLGQTRESIHSGVTLIQIKHSLLNEYILQGGDV
jgi:hypothetical protein